MIGIADRHIGRAAIGGILLALGLLVFLDAFFALISELDEIGKGEYDLGHALWFITLTLPRRAYELFPTAAVVGALLGVGGLAASSELVAYRTAGMSRLRIGGAVVMSSLVLLVPLVLMGEWIVPVGERLGQVVRVGAQSSGVTIGNDASLWVRDGDTIINAKRPLVSNVSSGDLVKLADIDVFEFVDDELRHTSHADYGEHDGENWLMTSVRRSRFQDGRVVIESNANEVWPSLLDPSRLQAAVARPKYLALGELFPYVAYLNENGLNAGPYQAAIWWRLTYPLGVVVVVLAGMPFVFGSQRSGGLGQRLFIGMLLGVMFYMANRMAGSMGEVYDLNPAITALTPSTLLFIATVWALRRGT
jgi:lipopolysaccharide export system permease protein